MKKTEEERVSRNKDICKRCKYHSYMGSNINIDEICCVYCLHTGNAATTRGGEDRRGDDPDNCLLFEEGNLTKNVPNYTAWSKHFK